jgi:hypothetical protein
MPFPVFKGRHYLALQAVLPPEWLDTVAVGTGELLACTGLAAHRLV